MKITQIKLTNFRCFESAEFLLDPTITLVIGNNTAGKSSLLDAIAVALGGFMLGIPAPVKDKTVQLQSHTRAIARQDIRRVFAKNREIATPEMTQLCKVEVDAEVHSRNERTELHWQRFIKGANGRTNNSQANSIKEWATRLYQLTIEGKAQLPLIAYYGTGRLWSGQKNSVKISQANTSLGYYYCLTPDQQNKILHEWIRHFANIEFVKGVHSPALRGVYATICKMLPDASAVYFSPEHDELFVEFDSGAGFPFSLLSDGQRSMISLAGDMAVRCAHLNQGLGQDASSQTHGIVLIDEIDLNVHPSWQQHLLPSLQKVFPNIQFVVTTHSPFIIQSLRGGSIINLDDADLVTDNVSLTKDQGVEEISEQLMGLTNTTHSQWFNERVELAKQYYALLDKGVSTSAEEVVALTQQLDELESRFGDNPAWIALMQAERKAAVGSI